MHSRAAQGRPKSGPEDKFRLTPVVPRLNELLGTTARLLGLHCCVLQGWASQGCIGACSTCSHQAKDPLMAMR